MKFFSSTLIVIAVILVSLLIVDMITPEFGFFAKVPAGHVGVTDYFGKIGDATLKPGFHVTKYFEHVRPIDVRTKHTSYQMEAFSSDIQQVILTVAVNENISPDYASTLYKTVGMSYENNLILPRLLENTKVVVSNYTAEALISSREVLSSQVLEKMQKDLDQYGINITNISIENIDFTDAFESAVEAKQVATQEKQRAKTQQEQQTMEAEQAAARKKIEAEAEAEVRRINAEADAFAIQTKADAEAEANKKVAETITRELIDYTQAQNWDGKLPGTYVGGGNSIPIIQPESDQIQSEIDQGE